MHLLSRLVLLAVTAVSLTEASLAIYYKPGNVTIGALLPIHGTTEDKVCNKLQPYGLGFAETLIYCIELINNSSEILRDITLGYDIRDYCESPTLAMKMTHEFVKQNFIIDFNLGACGNTSTQSSSKYTSRSTHAQHQSHISAVIGAHDSGSTVLVAELLGVVDIPLVSPFSTSEQLSSYPTFFRTIPPDGLQARAMADLITKFNWSYVGVVAVDHSYGRYGVKYLEKEAQTHTFCTGPVEYFPRLGYQTKMESIIDNLLKQKLVRVIVLWANSGQSIEFLKKANKKGLRDKVWILSDDVSALSSSVLIKIAGQINGVFLGVAHYYYKYIPLQNHFKKMLENPRNNTWWVELFESEFNCTLSGFESKRFPVCNIKHLNLSRVVNDLYNSYSPYLVDAVSAIARALNSMYNCSGGAPKCPTTQPFVNPEDLLKYLKNVSFEGVTGKVGFDQQGNPISSSYDIVHLHNNSQNLFVKTKIGTWSLQGGLQQLKEPLIKWNIPEKKPPSSVCMGKCAPGTWQTNTKNCCWECIPCKEGTVTLEFSAPKCKKCPDLQVASSKKNGCLDKVIVNVTLESDTGIVFAVISGKHSVYLSIEINLRIYTSNKSPNKQRTNTRTTPNKPSY